ncbi:MAG: hypothetical protein KGI27_09785 [Thaumarchaeota archaeon]|nr:hypothetical protein [Nitrososphaerota archaeon]
MSQRYYTLHEKQGNRWVRLTEMGFTLDRARRVFQNALIYQTWIRADGDNTRTTSRLELRPIREGR